MSRTVEELESEVARLRENNASKDQEIELLRQKIDLLVRKVFGSSSEKVDLDQLLLFEQQESKKPASSDSEEQKEKDSSPLKKTARSKRISREASLPDDLASNLSRIWNRMSSGSYFPPPVRKVEIPKKQGGVRVLGIPTIADRVAQTVVKLHLESTLDAIFDQDLYGYRPGKSAKQAVAITRTRCWKYHWVVEFDIKGAFDHIDHDLLMRAVRKHVKLKWAILYLKRWLTAPTLSEEGELESRSLGTPQGGVISPFLMNLYMHCAIDVWIRQEN